MGLVVYRKDHLIALILAFSQREKESGFCYFGSRSLIWMALALQGFGTIEDVLLVLARD